MGEQSIDGIIIDKENIGDNMLHCHSVHCRSHMDSPGVEPDSLQCQAGNNHSSYAMA
jgi:hypothetical protein